VHESIDSISIPTRNICKEKDLELFAVKLNLPKIKVVIIISTDHLLEVTTNS